MTTQTSTNRTHCSSSQNIENENLKSQIRDLESINNHLHAEIALSKINHISAVKVLERQNSKLQAEAEVLVGEKAVVQAELMALKAEIKTLNEGLEAAWGSIADLDMFSRVW